MPRCWRRGRSYPRHWLASLVSHSTQTVRSDGTFSRADHIATGGRRMESKHDVTSYTSMSPSRRRQYGDGLALPHRVGAGDGLRRCKSPPPRCSRQTVDHRTHLAVALVHRRHRGLWGAFRPSRNSFPHHSPFLTIALRPASAASTSSSPTRQLRKPRRLHRWSRDLRTLSYSHLGALGEIGRERDARWHHHSFCGHAHCRGRQKAFRGRQR